MAVETQFTNLSAGNYSAFNLMKDDIEQNVMIHIRVDLNQLVLNTRTNGSWGSEVRFDKPGVGTPGQLVTLRATIRSDHFDILVNKTDTYRYDYRTPWTEIKKGYVHSWQDFDTAIKNYTVFYH